MEQQDSDREVSASKADALFTSHIIHGSGEASPRFQSRFVTFLFAKIEQYLEPPDEHCVSLNGTVSPKFVATLLPSLPDVRF